MLGVDFHFLPYFLFPDAQLVISRRQPPTAAILREELSTLSHLISSHLTIDINNSQPRHDSRQPLLQRCCAPISHSQLPC